MIVVAVRDQRGGQRRQLIGPHPRRAMARDDGRDSSREDRIDEKVVCTERRKEGSVPDPRETRSRIGVVEEGQVGAHAGGRWTERSTSSLAGDAIEQAPAEDRPRAVRSVFGIQVRVTVGHSLILPTPLAQPTLGKRGHRLLSGGTRRRHRSLELAYTVRVAADDERLSEQHVGSHVLRIEP